MIGRKMREKDFEVLLDKAKGPDELIEIIKKFRADPPEITMDDLSTEQQNELMLYMRVNGFTMTSIAQTLKKGVSYISWRLGKIKAEFAEAIAQGGWQSIIGGLCMSARTASEHAMKDKDWALYWKVQSELFDRLQKVGMVPMAPQEVVVTDGTGDNSLGDFDSPDGRKRLAGMLGEFARRIEQPPDAGAGQEALPG